MDAFDALAVAVWWATAAGIVGLAIKALDILQAWQLNGPHLLPF
jgi:hypothetical protein